MKAIGVIPARFASTRFPGKVLAELNGRPLIQHVYEEALKASSLQDLLVATDEEKVVKAVEDFGGQALLTAKEHKSGTDRLREVVNSIDAKIVVNIQADEPLIHFSMIDRLVNCLSEDTDVPMATLIHRIEDVHELDNPNVVKVVKDKNDFALYFSRSLIPHSHLPVFISRSLFLYKHLGIYAYTKDFLFTFTNLPVRELERAEQLEQLRALENGYKIKVIETDINTIGVDTPEDLERVKQRMQEDEANARS